MGFVKSKIVTKIQFGNVLEGREINIQEIIQKLKEIDNISADKCNNECKNCPLNKNVLQTEVQYYDICDLLEEIYKVIK